MQWSDDTLPDGRRYFSSIDGLRAIAVLAVLGGHGALTFVAGGHHGVSVFFVISGFLISRHIISDLDAGRFSLWTFYSRRARRILPALYVFVLLNIPLFVLFYDGRILAKTLIVAASSLVSASNILYGFNLIGEDGLGQQPLIHTWSLGIEEQFYFILPLLLIVIGRSKFPSYTSWLAALVVFFFGLAVLAPRYFEIGGASYYRIEFRAWELLLGGLAQRLQLHWQAAKAGATPLSLLAIGAIIFAVIFDPGGRSNAAEGNLVSTLGAACLLIYAESGTVVHRLLATRLFVFIGLISYSLYLWHLPIFSYIRLTWDFGYAMPPEIAAFAVLVSVIVAWSSWKFVETPFRRSKLLRSEKAICLGAAAVSLVSAGGLCLISLTAI